MKRKTWLKPMLALAASSLLLGGCVVHETRYREVPAGTEVVVTSAPPPPPTVVEVRPVAPGVDFVWVGGYWAWGGGAWHWREGRWVRPPHPGVVWYGPHYVYRGGHHVWVSGGWR